MQKSQEGLLQSLLYEILSQSPEMIRDVCCARWHDFSLNSAKDPSPWTMGELSQVFAQLAKRTTMSAKFCFFIDGLDEYSGDHAEIITILRIITSAKIKICVSSRPWNIFQKAFGQDGKSLMLQEFTRNDIKLFVQQQLGEDEQFKEIKPTTPSVRNSFKRL